MIPRAMSRSALPPLQPSEDAIHVVEAMLDQRAPERDIADRYFAPEAVAERAEHGARQREDDWPALARYRAANAALRKRPELVMIGDSLTEIWQLATPELFGERIVNRGISGQTSPQMLLRFMADVVELSPRVVHILCGTNDIAGNTGPNLPEDFQRNVRAMTELATANGIAVLLGSVPPTDRIRWAPDANPRHWVPYLNSWLQAFAEERTAKYIDYFTALDDGNGALRSIYSADGVHVTRTAYQTMTKVLLCTLPGD